MRVLAVPSRDLGALGLGASSHVEPPSHLQAGERGRVHAERPVQDRIHREAVDTTLRYEVAGLRVGLDGHARRDAAADQHHAGDQPEQAVGRDRLDRPLDGAELVRHVLVEDARALLDVLRASHERVDLGPGIHAGILVRLPGSLEHQLLVGDARCRRGEP